ncbi:diguanylate cyclase domain-containing protein [Methylomarinum roseum]|uniref:diguanylate cyclase domain-containing protein n=1 Tax=Methylomarinum roseum TaxID=3067653 RepID=UPI003D7EC9DB
MRWGTRSGSAKSIQCTRGGLFNSCRTPGKEEESTSSSCLAYLLLIFCFATHSFKAALRRVDLLARWGGDEFMIILPPLKILETERQRSEDF